MIPLPQFHPLPRVSVIPLANNEVAKFLFLKIQGFIHSYRAIKISSDDTLGLIDEDGAGIQNRQVGEDGKVENLKSGLEGLYKLL